MKIEGNGLGRAGLGTLLFLLGLATACLGFGESAGRMPSTAMAQGPAADDAFASLNKAFRAAYAANRAELLARTRPVILAEGDKLVLLRQGSRAEVAVNPPLYHALKTVVHVPLAVFVMLAPGADHPLSNERLAEVERYRLLVEAARQELPRQGFSAAQLERQEKILRESLGFLGRVAASRRVSRDDLNRFTTGLEPLVLANVDAAARAQIDGINRQVSAWRQEMSAREWGELHVIVTGSHMPRRDNLAAQYFAKLLGVPGECDRLIYAEALFDEKRALDLLGTVLLDTDIGAAFFHDAQRMHRDLLGDAARAYLETLSFAPQPGAAATRSSNR